MMGKNSRGHTGQEGQTLFELIIALGIGVLIITAIVHLVTISVRNASFAKNKTEATRYAQQALEWIRNEKEQNWAGFWAKTGNPSYWCLPELSWDPPAVQSLCTDQQIGSTIFSREASFDQDQIDTDNPPDDTPDTDVVSVVVTVSWEQGGRTHHSQATTQFGETD